MKITATKKEVQNLYNQHQSIRKVGKILGVTGEGVRDFMKRNNLKINRLKFCDVDHDFFAKDTEKSFYWAGFLAADGCVVDGKAKRKIISLSLSTKDLCHLEKYTTDLKSNYKIYIGRVKKSKLVSKDFKKCEVKFESGKIVQDLSRFGIIPRKSLIYKMPEWLMSHKLLHHFIRGYFDGDGSAWVSKSKKPTDQIMFAIFGSEVFCNQVSRTVVNNCNLDYEKKARKKKGNLYVFEGGGNGFASKFFDYLYKDATVFLERKYNIIKKSKSLMVNKP